MNDAGGPSPLALAERSCSHPHFQVPPDVRLGTNPAWAHTMSVEAQLPANRLTQAGEEYLHRHPLKTETA